MMYQSDDAPFSFNLMPVTDGVVIDRGLQQLNVSLPQPINYSNLIIHSNQLTKASAPTAPTNLFENVPDSVAYSEVVGRELKIEESKSHMNFNKHYNNRIQPISVRPIDATDRLNNNVNLNIHHMKAYNKFKSVIGSLIGLVLLIIVIVIIIVITNKSKNDKNIIMNGNSTSYVFQATVLCTTGTSCGCSYSPCYNGGTCKMISSTSYACSCLLFYSGTNCQNYYNPCSSNPCLNGGVCYSANGVSYTCTCSSGYSGTYCQTYNPCYNNQCKNGATCSAVGSNYVCLCPYFYSGTYCQVFLWV